MNLKKMLIASDALYMYTPVVAILKLVTHYSTSLCILSESADASLVNLSHTITSSAIFHLFTSVFHYRSGVIIAQVGRAASCTGRTVAVTRVLPLRTIAVAT